MRVHLKSAILGLGFGIVAAASVSAFEGKKLVDITYNDLRIFTDEGKLQTEDGEPFIYRGSVYVPIRTVGEAVDAQVKWDAENNIIYLDKTEFYSVIHKYNDPVITAYMEYSRDMEKSKLSLSEYAAQYPFEEYLAKKGLKLKDCPYSEEVEIIKKATDPEEISKIENANKAATVFTAAQTYVTDIYVNNEEIPAVLTTKELVEAKLLEKEVDNCIIKILEDKPYIEYVEVNGVKYPAEN